MSPGISRAMWTFCLICVFSAGAIYTRAARNEGLRLGSQWSDPDEYRPRYSHVNGDQIAFLYIGSSSCTACNDRRLPAALRSLRAQAHAYADSINASFVAIGATNDWRVDKAYDHLRAIGRFDQVVLGGSWSNPLLIATTWRGGYVAAVPAIAVLRRSVAVPQAPDEIFDVQDEEILFYISGLDSILHQELLGLEAVLRQRVASEAR